MFQSSFAYGIKVSYTRCLVGIIRHERRYTEEIAFSQRLIKYLGMRIYWDITRAASQSDK